MSISQEERRSEALALLKLLFQVLGESAIDCTRFDSSDARFRGIQSTSWDELCSEGLLKMQTDSLYVFTPAGWSEAVFRAGIVSASDFKECLGRLSGVLKGHVKRETKGRSCAL